MIRTCLRYSRQAAPEEISATIRDAYASSLSGEVHSGGVSAYKVLDGTECVSVVVRPDRRLCIELSDGIDRVKWLSWIPQCVPNDSGFTMQKDPVICDEQVKHMIDNVLDGKASPYLPIVVVPVSDDWIFPVDPWMLSETLYGQAYVIAVLSPGVFRDVSVIHKGVCRSPEHLISSLSVTSFEPGYPSTWDEVMYAKIAELEAEKPSLDTEAQDEIQMLTEEVEALSAKLKTREKDLLSVRAECDSLRKMSCSGMLLDRGEEKDYYPGEVRETLLSVLSDASRVCSGRKKDIVNDLLDANPSIGSREKLSEELSGIMQGSNGMNDRLKADLERLGFNVVHGGKHYRLTWHDDKRYKGTMAVSPSNTRARVQSEHELRNVIFGT